MAILLPEAFRRNSAQGRGTCYIQGLLSDGPKCAKTQGSNPFRGPHETVTTSPPQPESDERPSGEAIPLARRKDSAASGEPEENQHSEALLPPEPPDDGPVAEPEHETWESPPPKRSAFSKFVKWGLISLLTLLVVVLGITQTAWGRERIRKLAVDGIQDGLGLDAQLAEVEVGLSLFPPGIEVIAEGIALAHPEHGDLVVADALRIRPSLGAFLRGAVDLENIELDGPEVSLVMQDGAIVNLPTLPESESDGPVELPFSHVGIRDGRVSLEVSGEPADFSVLLEGLDIQLDADGSALEVDLIAHRGEFDSLAGVEIIEELTFGGGIELDSPVLLDVSEASVSTEPAEVRLSELRLPIPADGDWANLIGWQGRVEARVDVERALQIARPFGLDILPLAGRLEVDIDAREESGNPEAEGEISIRQGMIDNRYGLGDIRLQVKANLEEVQILEGSQAQLWHEGGVLSLVGRVGLDPDEGMPLEVDVGADNLQLEKLMDQLGVGPDSIVHWPMTGRARLAGTLDPLDLGGPVDFVTSSFWIYNGPYHDPRSEPMLQTPRGHIQGRWHFSAEALRFSNLTLDTARSHVEVPMVHIGYNNTFRVRAQSQRLDLQDVSPLVDIEMAGVAQAQVEIGFDFDDPKVWGHMSVDGYEFAGFRLGDVDSDFRLTDNHMGAYFPSARVTKNTSRYRVDDLLLDFTDHLQVTGDFHAERMLLADLYHIFGFEEDERFTPFQAVARGNASLHYTLGFPGDSPNGTLEMGLRAQLLEPNFAGIAFEGGELEADWKWFDWGEGVAGGHLELEHFTLGKGGGTISVQGRMRRGTQLELSVAADSIPVEASEPFFEMPELHGVYSILGTVRGTTGNPRLDLDVSIAGLRWNASQIGDGRAYVRLTERSDPWVAEAAGWDEVPEGAVCGHARRGFAQGRWRPSPPVNTVEGPQVALDQPMAFLVCGEGANGQINVDLALGWTDVYPTRGRIDFRNYDLTPYLRDMQPADGVLNGTIELTGGALRQQHRMAGSVLFDRFDLNLYDEQGQALSVRNRGPIDMEIDNGIAQIRRAIIDGPGSRLELSGTVTHDLDLALVVSGGVDLGILPELTPAIQSADGSLGFNLNVNGALDDPEVFGEGMLRSEQIQATALPAPVRDLQALVTFSERRVILDEVRAEVGGGRFLASGAATMRDGELDRYEIDLDLRNINVRPGDGIDVVFDYGGRLEWAQGERLPTLRGDVRLERARYRRDMSLSPTLGELYRPQVAEVEAYDPEADRVALDLRVVTQSPIQINNNLLRGVNVEIDDGDRPFRILGTDQRFGVVGNLTIPRGSVRFRSTILDISRGEIRFEDENRVDPHFDVWAETEIRRQQSQQDASIPAWRVQLRAHGTQDAFRLDASSDPQLSQDDIMLLLTVGLTSAEAQALLREGDIGSTALEVLSALSGVNEEVTNAVGLIDDFAISTRYSPVTGTQEPVITVGKRISDRVRISAATGLTANADQTRTIMAGLEWQVGDQTSVQVSYDSVNRESASSFGNIGVDLHWRLEFE